MSHTMRTALEAAGIESGVLVSNEQLRKDFVECIRKGFISTTTAQKKSLKKIATLADIFEKRPNFSAPHSMERLTNLYTTFVHAYNMGASSMTNHVAIEKERHFPSNFIELATSLGYTWNQLEGAWTSLHYLLEKAEVRGIYENPEMPEGVQGLTKMVVNLVDRVFEAQGKEGQKTLIGELENIRRAQGGNIQKSNDDPLARKNKLVSRIKKHMSEHETSDTPALRAPLVKIAQELSKDLPK